ALEGIRRALGDAKPEHILTDELQESLKALAEALARSKIPAAGREAIAGATGALLQAADLLEAAAEQATGAAVVSINQVLPDPPLNGTAPHAQTPVEAAAWKFAIQQAERMIEKGEVRPEHREIVRKYFSR
ncbi:MAG: hypothetical protein QGD94_01275, partial [Planctomycetia bacterium]|nr:hypothetical protein [Planctomycetia bacterium]